MASPPFNPAITTPQDNDFVSQYPLAERTFRDIMNSWLLIDHNNNGQHVKVTLPQIATPTTPASGLIIVYQTTTGTLAYIDSTGTVFQIGDPTGTVVDFAGASAPNGWLLCFGQAVSRTTYANLFAVLSTTYGAGDGSTTFNLPDYRGKVSAGIDNMGGVAAGFIGTVVTDTGTIVGTTRGSVGGSSTHVQATGEIGQHNHSATSTVTDPGHTHDSGVHILNPAQGLNAGGVVAGANGSVFTSSSTTGITVGTTIGFQGNSTAMAWLQPTIMMNKIIKI